MTPLPSPVERELLWEVADSHPRDTAARLRLLTHYLTTGQPERAEFIRLHLAEADLGERTPAEIRRAAAELLKAHEGRWRAVGCPECRGTRKSGSGGTCLACDGLGDCGGLVTLTGGKPFWTLPVVWAGGTPHAVLCNLFDAVAADGSVCRWAFRVCGHHPTVREFRLADRVPVAAESRERPVWAFRAGGRTACDENAERVPEAVLEAMADLGTYLRARENKWGDGLGWLYYGSDAAARAALAEGVGVLVRRAVNAARKNR